jgi:hypothetical protein
VVVAVNGVHAPASGRARRLVRRGLLVAAIAGAGWLLSVLFAANASADELPMSEPDTVEPMAAPAQQPAGGLLGGLTDLTGSLFGTVADTTSALPSVVPPAKDEPAETLPDLPELLHVLDTPDVTPPSDHPAGRSAVPPRPSSPPATPSPPATAAAPEHTPRPVVTNEAPQRTAPSKPPRKAAERPAGEQAHSSQEQPTKAPAAPVGPSGGTVASSAHDSSGGARGTHHGVLTAQAPLAPHSAGWSTRGRAADASGRITGLPATSPD